MKQNDLTPFIANASEAVHRAYHGECLSISWDSDYKSMNQIWPAEDIVSLPPDWLHNNVISSRRERMLLASAATQLRHYVVRQLAVVAYDLLQKGGIRRDVSPGTTINPSTVCKIRESLDEKVGCSIEASDGPQTIAAVQRWKNWDPVEVQGWIHENVELAVTELDLLWPKIRTIALRLKINKVVPARIIREICSDILGAGLKGDREIETITRFYHDSIYFGCPLAIGVEDGVSFVKFPQDNLDEPVSLKSEATTSEIIAHLERRMDALSMGTDPAAAAARLFLLLHNGNYVIDEGDICAVSMPIDPGSGDWSNISKTAEALHPMPKDYGMCARYLLNFALSGFMWPTLVAIQESGGCLNAGIDEVIDHLWLPAIYEMYYLIASPQWVNNHDALGYVAALFARLVAVEGWLNPLTMRQKLKEILRETCAILLDSEETVRDIEEALRCGLANSGEDLKELCGGAVDGRFDENPRYGILVRYMRERAVNAGEVVVDEPPSLVLPS